MKNLYSKMCALLAGTNFNNKELRAIIIEIKNTPLDILLEDIHSISMHERYDGLHEKNEYFFPSEIVDEVVEKIEELLIKDCNLTRSTASGLLYSALTREFPDVHFLSPSRMGFSNWISKVVITIPPSELLHIAYMVKNSVIGGNSIDWKLMY